MSEQAQEMSFYQNFSENTQHMTREERINLRNDIVMMYIYTGLTKQKVAEKFRISIRTVERILEGIHEASDEWYKQLPKRYALAIHRRNSNKVFNEITKLSNIRSKAKGEPDKEFQMTHGIIDAYIKYDKMVAEGPTLERQKELTEEMEKIVESNAA